MANQDILFPFLPRNTRVDIRDQNLRVKRTPKKPANRVVSDEEAFDPTQDARVHAFMRGDRHPPGAANHPSAHELGHAHQTPIAEDPVATDPRRKHLGHDDDDHKGTRLDTFV